MLNPIKKVLTTIVFLFLVSLWPRETLAQMEFSTAYSVTYDLSQAPYTTVDFVTQVTNLTNRSYVSDYSLLLNSTSTTNVEAFDRNGSLETQTEKSGDQTRIRTFFKDKIVGKGSVREWHTQFADRQAGRKSGLVWSIQVPKLDQSGDLDYYSAHLLIPESFGQEIYSSPRPTRIEKDGNQRIYHFESNDLREHGALLSFGDFQLYSFRLKYHLENTSLLPTSTEIALPPSLRGEQEIYLRKIEPAPENLRVDADGNHLATYKLPGRQKLSIIAEGYARIEHPSRNSDTSGYLSEIPANLSVYLKEQPYWELSNPLVKDIVQTKTQPGQTVAGTARALFEFTTQKLTYNKNRISSDLTRFGAKKALERSTEAICMEFADLLVTLLRKAGIPAQVLEGYAFTEDDEARPVLGDVLHSWIRYYDPRIGWISVDPTWSATSGLDFFSRLDTNHFVFAVKGSSSLQPAPAGAYKLNPYQTGDVQVSPIEADIDFPEASTQLTANIDANLLNLIFNPKLQIEVSNTSGVAIFDGRLKLAATPPILPIQEFKVGDLPPYARKSVLVNLKTPLLRGDLPFVLEIRLNYGRFSGEFSQSQAEQRLKLTSNFFPLSLIFGSLAGLVLWLFQLSAIRPLTRRK